MPLQISELLDPIPGSAPGGAYLRYDPVYDQIRQARIEDEELPSGELDGERRTADYALVIKLARDLLANRSKDLQVAAWLTEALLKREGFAGLRSGFELIQRLLEEFWDHLHPELEDGDAEFRAAPLDWLGQYTFRAVRLMPVSVAGHHLGQYKEALAVGYEADATSYAKRDERNAAIQAGRLTAEEFDEGFNATPTAWYRQQIADIDAALDALNALDATSRERFGVDAPRYDPLREAIEDVRRTMAELLARKPDGADPEPEVVEEVPAGESPLEGENGAGPVAEGGTVAVPGLFAGPAAAPAAAAAPLPKGRAGAEASIAAAARVLRAESRTDPGPYLMLRGLRWGELRAGGELDPARLAAPPTEVRTRVKALLLEERWEELLEAAEEVMATPYGRGWLDLQRYVVTACDALGGDYLAVGSAVRGAIRALLEDLPELPSSSLADDTPAANGETRAWLRQQGLLPEGGAPVPEEVVLPRPRSRVDVQQRAEELARAGKPERAVELLMAEAAQERSARGSFLRRTQAAALLVDDGKETVALPILEQISDLIDQHSLEGWEEASTVAEPLGLLYRCRLAEGNGGAAYALYERICRLDPMLALRLGPPDAAG